MSSLPRPDLPPGPHRDLVAALHDLHHRAGWPSLRTLARDTGVSHTTVSKTFSRPGLPSWGTLELLVEAMRGDTAHFHDLWLAASTPVDGPDPSRTTRMAGRTTELAAVRRHLETGMGLLLVTGEAGIGKTTLIRAAAEQSDAFISLGHCLPMSTEAPLMPVADALRNILETDSAWFADALRECPAFVPRALQRLLPELEAGEPGMDTSQQLFAAAARLLARLRDRRPLGLVIEDLHWADTTTLDLVEHLVASGAEVSMVGSWRTHDRSVSDGHVDWLGRVQRLVGPSDDLPPLTSDETADQLRLLVGASATPELAARIHQRSRGHPLFTEHLAAGLATEEAMPRHLAEVLDRRLGHLGDVAGRLAAVLGTSDRDLPAAVLGDAAGVPPAALLVGLKELSSRELVTQDAQDRVTLSHPLLAEAARRRLVAGEARAIHAALAAALGSQPTRGEHAAEIAAHWRHAAEPAAELGARVEAARLAHLRTAPKEESEHWLRALEIAGESPGLAATFDRAEAVIGAIDALQLCNRLEDALALARAALQRVDQVDDPLTEAEILRRAAQVEAIAADDGDACLALTDRAVELLRPLPPSECLVHTLDLRANELSRRGAHDQAVTTVREALAIATDLGDAGLYYGSSATLLWQLAHQGDLPAALRQLALARERHPAPAGPHREAYMSMCVSDALLLHRRPAADVVAATRRAFDVAGEFGLDFHMLTIVRANVAEAHLNNGEITRAADALDAVRTSDVYDEWPLRVIRASVQIAQGSPDHALETLEHMPDLRRTNNLTVCRVRTTARLWQGRADLAWLLVRGALELALEDPAIGDFGESYVTAARAAADLATQGGAPPGALSEELLDLRRRASVDPLGPGPMPVGRDAWTAAWEAERARLLSRDAVDLWTTAAGAHDRISSPHDAAYCRWRAARCALRDGRGTLASRLLARAAADAREHVPLSRAIAATAAAGS